ncbi:MAG: hypothetical protein ACTSYB_08125 [Candidatus Helarchaeota archaeon]
MKKSYKIPQLSEIPAPFLPIKIYDITKTLCYPQKGTINALIDTGYDGFLIVPLKIFNQLKLISSEIPTDQLSTAETIVGEHLELRTALGHVEIPELNFFLSLEIDTYPNCLEILIGRQLLEYLVVTLNGRERILITE